MDDIPWYWIVLPVLAIVAVVAFVWRDADRDLDRAKQEYLSCRISASTPEAVSHCESEWKKAQDAYYIP